MNVIEPSFEIDKKGRAICKSHTHYQFFKSPHKSIYEEKQVEKLLTCKTCAHYFNDNCYFPRREIDIIERDRHQERIKCQLCGNKIHRSLTFIQSLYYEAKFNVKLPLICCDCHSSLNDDTFMQKTKLRLIGFIISFIVSLYIIFYFFITVITIGAWIILGLIPLLFWFVRGMKDIKRIWDLREGRKYYQKFFAKSLNDREEN